MARSHHRLISFLSYALIGAIGGALVIGLAGFAVLSLTPAPFEATVVLFHTPGSDRSDSGRDFIAATLGQPDFLNGVANREGWDAGTAKRIARHLSVGAADASRPIAELKLSGTDERTIAREVNAVARQMVAVQRERQKETLERHTAELDATSQAVAQRLQVLAEVQPDGEPLTRTVSEAVDRANTIAEQRFERALAARYRLRFESTLDDRKRRRALDALITQQKRFEPELRGDATFGSARFEHELTLGRARAEATALQQAKQRLDNEFGFIRPLQIVRPAKANPIATTYTPALVATALGGLLGFLVGGVVWSRRQSPAGLLNGPTVEKALGLPVAGVAVDYLTEYGEREHQVLAETDQEHLALAGIRSLRVGLHVLARATQRDGPIVITGLDARRDAPHIVANLAVIAAQAGERVLVVDDSRDNALPAAIFGTERDVGASPSPGINTADGSEPAAEKRIQLVRSRDAGGNAAVAQRLPVPGEIEKAFDRCLVFTDDVATVRQILKHYTTALGIAVCPANIRISALRKARARTLDGIVLCAIPLDDSLYGESVSDLS